MGASSKGGMRGPNTAGPGGQGRDYNGNARGSNMPGEFNIGGPRMIGGAYGQPIFGGRPNPGDLYRRNISGPGYQTPSEPNMPEDPNMPPPMDPSLPPPGGNRFMPGGGMIPPAGGRIGNPRQVNPGRGGMRPGQPGQPGLGGIVNEAGRAGGGIINGLFPGLGGQLPPGSLDKGIQYGIGQMFPGMGGGKGGMPGPGRPGFGPGGPVIDDMRYKAGPGEPGYDDNNIYPVDYRPGQSN